MVYASAGIEDYLFYIQNQAEVERSKNAKLSQRVFARAKSYPIITTTWPPQSAPSAPA